MIKVNEVIHLYPQCKIRVKSIADGSLERVRRENIKFYSTDHFTMKLLGLRPLSSLTDAEKCELYRLDNYFDHYSTELERVFDTDQSIMVNLWKPAQTLYLLKLSVDLFGLLDSNQAEKLEL